MPYDFFTRNGLCYLLFGVVDVFVTLRPLIAELVGATFDVSRPPSTDIVDGSEGFFRSLVYYHGSSEIVHGSLQFWWVEERDCGVPVS